MKEIIYLNLRKVFFWLFFLAFLALTPVILYYSLGFKFNRETKKFQRTGAISIKTMPAEAVIYLDGEKLSAVTPYVLRELLPKKYSLSLEKEGFYSSEITAYVKSSAFTEIDTALMPKMRNIDKLKLDFDVYKFFVTQYFLGKRIIAFTDKGIYFLDENFNSSKEIAPLGLDKSIVNTVEDIKEGRDKFIFWNKRSIWLVDMSQQEISAQTNPNLIYSRKELIKGAFFALKESYIIIHDGSKVVALDIKYQSAPLVIHELSGPNAEIYYDSGSDILYINDRVPDTSTYSLFKINLMELMHERIKD